MDIRVDLGEEGRRAVETLFERAKTIGVLPRVTENFFLYC